MTTIVLLDNDKTAVDALASDLKAQRTDWIIHTATGGQQAVELACSVSVDVLITETQLPDMSGMDLLDKISALSEDTIRVTLTADLEAEVMLESSRSNHRFIAKPVSAGDLASTINDSLKLRAVLEDEALKKYMRNITTVPAVPTIYDEMTQELASPHSSLTRVSGIIETDAGLTITVLKIVNSAFYGLSRRVESVAQAVTLLGVHLIKNITLTAKVFAKFEGSQVSVRRLTELNEQALRMGALANQFARYAKLSKSGVDHCQIAGLMCNLGELIQTANSDKADDSPDLPAPLIGAYLLRMWKLPDAIVEAVALQHDSEPQLSDTVSPLHVLHSIRYLQTHYADTDSDEQRQHCMEYLSQFISGKKMLDLWLNSYQASEQLSASSSQRAA